MTLPSEAYQAIWQQLQQQLSPSEAKAEARWLLTAIAGISPEAQWRDAAQQTPLSAHCWQQLKDLVAQRLATRTPLAHLLGTASFYGMSLTVSPAVLIPRPETEELVALALEKLNARPTTHPLRIVDLGTGSGAIALALATTLVANGRQVAIIATDLSTEALEVARQNAEALGLADVIQFFQADWWQGWQPDGPLDLVVSNPPYVPREQRTTLAPELAHEPASALFVEDDVLAPYRQILDGAAGALAPGGWLICECGPAQAGLPMLCLAPTWRHAELQADISGNPRLLVAQHA